MPISAEKVLSRLKAADSRKSNWNETYKDAVRYTAPHRETFDYHTPGAEKSGRNTIFDSSGGAALDKFVSNLQSSLFPIGKRNMELVPGSILKQADQEAQDEQKKALEKITDIYFDALHNSNFDTQIAECFYDLASGTACLMVVKGDARNPLKYIAVPISQLWLEEGAEGSVKGVFREREVTADNIQDTWPEATLTDEMKKEVIKNPDKKFTIVDCCLPAQVEVPDIRAGKKVKVDGYEYHVVCKDTKEPLLVREQRTSPFIVFRWMTVPGEVYGRGPLLNALPDIKTINKTKELVLKNAAMSVAGAFTVADDGVVNVRTARIKPGAMIPVASNGGPNGASIKALERSGDFNVGMLVINDLRQSINEMMFTEPLGPVDLPVKSATEVSMRVQAMAKRIGSSYGRIKNELNKPKVERELFILDELGLINLSDFIIDGVFLGIKYTSPLDLADDEEDLLAIIRWVEFMIGTYGAQVAMLTTKPDIVSRKTAELLNLPAELVPSKEDMADLKQVLIAMFSGQQGGDA